MIWLPDAQAAELMTTVSNRANARFIVDPFPWKFPTKELYDRMPLVASLERVRAHNNWEMFEGEPL